MIFSQGAGAKRRTPSSPPSVRRPAEAQLDHLSQAAVPNILAAEGVVVQTNIGKADYPQNGRPTKRSILGVQVPKQTPNHELGAPVFVPNHAIPVAHLLPYEQSPSCAPPSCNGPIAEGIHLCYVPYSVVCPQWVYWEAQQQQYQLQYYQHYQQHYHQQQQQLYQRQQQYQPPLLQITQQGQEQRRRQLVAIGACSTRVREIEFDAARHDDMAASNNALKRKFDAFVMCNYTPRHPSKLPIRRWVSLDQLYHLIWPHAPMDVWLKGPGNLKQLIAGASGLTRGSSDRRTPGTLTGTPRGASPVTSSASSSHPEQSCVLDAHVCAPAAGTPEQSTDIVNSH